MKELKVPFSLLNAQSFEWILSRVQKMEAANPGLEALIKIGFTDNKPSLSFVLVGSYEVSDEQPTG